MCVCTCVCGVGRDESQEETEIVVSYEVTVLNRPNTLKMCFPSPKVTEEVTSQGSWILSRTVCQPRVIYDSLTFLLRCLRTLCEWGLYVREGV